MRSSQIPFNFDASNSDEIRAFFEKISLEEVASFLEENHNNANLTFGNNNSTLLIAAVYYDRIDLVKPLLSSGANPYLQNSDGHTVRYTINKIENSDR